jgi:hypothetical protein
MKTLRHRRPLPSRRFAWSRVPCQDICHWRLFRRDLSGRVHMKSVAYFTDTDRRVIAQALRRLRRELLDHVDAIDFAALGIAA